MKLKSISKEYLRVGDKILIMKGYSWDRAKIIHIIGGEVIYKTYYGKYSIDRNDKFFIY